VVKAASEESIFWTYQNIDTATGKYVETKTKNIYIYQNIIKTEKECTKSIIRHHKNIFNGNLKWEQRRI